MTTNGLGDLAQGFALRNRTATLKQDLQRLSLELSTGQVANPRDRLAGNFSYLAEVERGMSVLSVYATANEEAAQFTGAMQLQLESYRNVAQELSSTLLTSGTTPVRANPLDVAGEARAALDTLVARMNSSYAGRSLFAGSATDSAPLVDSDTLLSAVNTAMAGATTPADMIAAAQTWFADPAGFAAVAYQGSTQGLSPFALSETESVAVDLRADDPALTRTLQNAAVAALATEPGFGLTSEDQRQLFSLTGQDLLVAQDGIVAIQGNVGFAEGRIEAASVRNAAEETSLTMARNALLEADPYEAATKLEEVQFQLQSLYTTTVRMSQLSLVNFL